MRHKPLLDPYKAGGTVSGYYLLPWRSLRCSFRDRKRRGQGVMYPPSSQCPLWVSRVI
jgi:hypothetical protein